MEVVNFNDDYRIFFIHIPKNAGTALKKSLEIPIMAGITHQTPFYFQKQYPTRWNNYFKFTVIRNPLDRFLSAYLYNHNLAEEGSIFDYDFEKFILHVYSQGISYLKMLAVHFIPQTHWLLSNSEPIYYDMIFDYDCIEYDLQNLCRLCKLPVIELKKENFTVHGDYKGYYTSKTATLINELYQDDNNFIKGLSWIHTD